MPVDPTISLKVAGGASGPADANTAGTTVNPMATAQTFAETQQKLNAVKLFGQQNQARLKFGQIAAEAPSMEAAVAAASKDPAVAPFVPDIIQSWAGTMNSVQQFKGLKSAQTTDAFSHTMDVLTGGLIPGGSTGVKKNFDRKLGMIYDPEIRGIVGKSGSAIIDGLTDGLDKLDDKSPDGGKTPSPRDAEYAKRLFAAGASIPGVLDALKSTAGASDQVDTGEKIQPGVRRGPIPTILGPAGQFSTTGNGLTKGLAPQIAQPGGVVVGGGRGTGAPPVAQSRSSADAVAPGLST